MGHWTLGCQVWTFILMGRRLSTTTGATTIIPHATSTRSCTSTRLAWGDPRGRAGEWGPFDMGHFAANSLLVELHLSLAQLVQSWKEKEVHLDRLLAELLSPVEGSRHHQRAVEGHKEWTCKEEGIWTRDEWSWSLPGSCPHYFYNGPHISAELGPSSYSDIRKAIVIGFYGYGFGLYRILSASLFWLSFLSSVTTASLGMAKILKVGQYISIIRYGIYFRLNDFSNSI